MIHIYRHAVETPIFDASTARRELTGELAKYFEIPSDKRQSRPPLDKKRLLHEYATPLRAVFHSKCAFSERRVRKNFSFVHFRPPYDAVAYDGSISNPHYYWLAYRWANLYLAHPITVRAKGHHFPVIGKRVRFDIGAPTPEEEQWDDQPVLIDPCGEEPSEFLRFAENGYVYPNHSGDDPHLRGKATVSVLELNDPKLIRARARSWTSFAAWWRPSMPLERYAVELGSNQEFAGMKRQCIARRLLQEGSSDAIEAANELLRPEMQAVERWDVIPDADDSHEYATKSPEPHVQVLGAESDDGAKTYRLSRVEIQNFKGIDRLSLDIGPDEELRDAESDAADEDVTASSDDASADRAAQAAKEVWQILLGENASGKTCVLQAIAAALCWDEESDLPSDAAWWRDLRRRRARSPTIVTLQFHGRDDPYRVEIDKDRVRANGHLPRIDFLRGYGATRLPSERGGDVQRGPRRAYNLFHPWSTLVNPIDFLLSLSDDEFARAAQVVRTLFGVDKESDAKIGLLKRTRNSVSLAGVPIDVVSDGYRSVLTLACDLLSAMGAPVSDHSNARGIVLIDELGVNLHPRWRMKIVTALREIFSGMQFIASTHEPLCLRGLEDGEIARIWREGKKVRLATDLPSPRALRVDQLLTSPIFGLHSSIDPELEEATKRYYALLRKAELTKQEQQLRAELRQQIFGSNTLGNTRRDQLVYLAIDQLLANQPHKSDEALVEKAMSEIESIWDFDEGLQDYL